MDSKIQEIMAKAFEVPKEDINEQSTHDTVENWDSIHHIKLIVFLERAYNISIPDERVGNMISYKLIESVVYGCL